MAAAVSRRCSAGRVDPRALLLVLTTPLLSGGYEPVGDSPEPLSAVDAVYPVAALGECLAGHVIVDASISGDGRVLSVRVVLADPAGVFDDAALSAVRQWLFEAVGPDDDSIELRGARYRIVFEPDPSSCPATEEPSASARPRRVDGAVAVALHRLPLRV